MRKWKLFFCHIPKTGGTSLRRALEARVRPSETVPDDDALKRNDGKYPPLNVALAMAQKRAESIRFFRGHYHLSCRHFLPGNFSTVVVLRDPLERNISLFRHMIAHQGKSRESLMEQLYAGKAIGPDNTMTRFLGGSLLRSPDGKFSDTHLLGGAMKDPELMLQQALAALASCEHVGLTSNLLALQGQLSDFTGTRLSVGVHNESEGPDPVFTPQEIAAFERHNALDRRLYEYAAHLPRATLES
jgi:hypothetical protein